MAKSIQRATLELAIQRAGSKAALSRKLGPNPDTLEKMVTGESDIPMWLFLRIVDHLNEIHFSGLDDALSHANYQDAPETRQ